MGTDCCVSIVIVQERGAYMVRVIDGLVTCDSCGSEMVKEAGYYRCAVCFRRFYGDPSTEAYNDGCINCGTVYLKCQRFCPRCGLGANDF